MRLSQNCTQKVLKNCEEFSDALALWHPNANPLSFSQFYRQVAHIQGNLRGRLEKGDYVLMAVEVCPELYTLTTALLARGVTLILVEPWMPLSRIQALIAKIKPKAFVASRLGRFWGMRVEAIRKIKNWWSVSALTRATGSNLDVDVIETIESDHPAILTFTSGSSGTPKGVIRSHQYLSDQYSVLDKSLNLSAHEGADLCIFASFAMANLVAGRASLLMPSSWKKKDIKSIFSLDSTLAPVTATLSPYFLKQLMNCGEASFLHELHLGGALCDLNLVKRVLSELKNTQTSFVYGSTEAEPVAICDLSETYERSLKEGYFQALYLGKPIQEIDWQISEAGLWVSGRHVAPKYLENEEENRRNKRIDENGKLWHFMGDRVSFDGEGFWLEGRSHQDKKEFIQEQKLYQVINSSKAFIAVNLQSKRSIFLEDMRLKAKLKASEFECFPVEKVSLIYDRRHRSRLDRKSSLNTGRQLMNKWKIFFSERVPLLVYALIAMGMAFSSQLLETANLDPSSVAIGFFVVMAYLVTLRLMDEVKDFEKDCIANPDRPLPRGLLSVEQVKPKIRIGLFLMLLMSIFALSAFNWQSSFLILVASLHLWLMYKEFFIGDWLEKRPFLYASTHQLSLLWLCAVSSVAWSGEGLFSEKTWMFGLLIIGSFFSFEICRKLDPSAHSILRTYRASYGLKKTYLAVLILQVLVLFSAYRLDLLLQASIPSLILLIGFPFLVLKKYKWVEGLASLALLWHLWFIFIVNYVFGG